MSFFSNFNKKKAEASTVENKEEGKAETPAVETETPAVTETTETTETEAKPETKLEVPAETAAPEKGVAASPTQKSKFNLSSFIKREKSPAPKAEKADEKAEEGTEPEIADKAVSTNPPFLSLNFEANPSQEPEATPAAEPVAEAATETPVEETSAEAATSPKESKRKSSFFSGFKGKKAEEPKSDEQTAEEAAHKSTSPVSKISGLVRKVSSRGTSKPKEDKEKEVASPATVTEEPETVSAEPVKTEAEPAAAEPVAATEPQSIGDVVPDAVNVGQAPVKASA